jgi:hypothetical protein
MTAEKLHPDPTKLAVGDQIDFSITTRYEQHVVTAMYEHPVGDGQTALHVKLRAPGGSMRDFPAVRLHDIDCERPSPEPVRD